MSDQSTIDDASTGELYVLLGLVSLHEAGRVPANSPQIEDACEGLPDPDGTLVGRLSEAEVTKTLYTLESDGLVEEFDADGRTPAGKGRPEYDLAVDLEPVLAVAASRPELDATAGALRE